MKVVIQRVLSAEVKVDGEIVGAIQKGFLLFVGFEVGDTVKDYEKAASKVGGLRIFEDSEGKMNLGLKDVGGSILSISQFTLAGSCVKGNRPSFIDAMEPKQANAYYEAFNVLLRDQDLIVETGVFQEDMKVSLVNDGPVTLILNIKNGKVL